MGTPAAPAHIGGAGQSAETAAGACHPGRHLCDQPGQCGVACGLFQNAWPFDMVVLDESSSFKNSQSKRFKALKLVRSRINRLVELTGTPASNGLIDLWAQIYLLDGGARLGRTLGQYRERFSTRTSGAAHRFFLHAKGRQRGVHTAGHRGYMRKHESRGLFEPAGSNV